MSITEEDTELRELVVQTLESNGVLGKLKAQTRASVILALEEEEKKNPFENESLNLFSQTSEGSHVISLFKEFLKFYKLEYTLSVFEPESNSLNNCNREKLAKELNIDDNGEVSKKPLICEILRRGPKPRPSLEENSFDLEKMLKEKVQKRVVNDSKDNTESNSRSNTDSTSKRPSNLESNARSKNIDENDGSSSSSNKIQSAGEVVKALKWDKNRAPSGDSEQSLDLESTNKSVTPRSKNKSLRSPSRGDDNEDYEDDDDIEEDINEEGSATNRSESIPNDEATSDRTISMAEQSVAYDYMEEVLKS